MSIWVKLGLIGGLIAFLIGWHVLDKKMAVKAAIQATEVSMNIEYQKKLDDAKMKAKKTEDALKQENENAIKDKDRKIKDINTKLSSVLGKLQFYKACSTASRNTTTSGDYKACPGTKLSREDAEFLAREAARADEVVTERNFYYDRYENARQRLGSR